MALAERWHKTGIGMVGRGRSDNVEMQAQMQSMHNSNELTNVLVQKKSRQRANSMHILV